jgi:uncharacterized metal-binding protein YceD (DUF177 family)
VEKSNKEFLIPVKGLEPGEYHYDFVVEDAFFEQFAFQDIHHGKITLSLDIEKESRLMALVFNFAGALQLICDRCLDSYSQPVQGDFRLIVKYGEKMEEVSDELVTIPYDDSYFDIAQYVYEFIRLMIPMKRIHPDDKNGNSTCNVEMLKKLEDFEETKTDPRWDALKGLKNKEITDKK